MATPNFHDRLERINRAHEGLISARGKTPIRALRSQPLPRTARRRFLLFDHMQPLIAGSVLGCLAAVLLTGLTSDKSPWGPGTALNEVMFLPALGGLILAPMLMLASLFLAIKKPGFALFSLSYLTGMVVTMMI